ncbi:hypothetical protein BU23DRAFT_564960 [Bimuria novae-zelandiae CBS 107.79]|uniref:Uncharacterized protein n=1 Tax=Bimuria novae-zelandiae CBS 107.79 TaxID=1447943 RepID=A0A6A5VIJ8_9PLEO|nr:hypothetical protein BU23DRAFT_564960 [Bimuria novae-zelandiae CBS 107.79]
MHLDSAIQSHIWMDHPNRRHPFNTLAASESPNTWYINFGASQASGSRGRTLEKELSMRVLEIGEFLTLQDIPSLSIGQDVPLSLQADSTFASSKEAALLACNELSALLRGSFPTIANQNGIEFAATQALCRFKIPARFPAGRDSATYAELAASSGLVEPEIRLVRASLPSYIFSEREKEVVTHIAASKCLATNPLMVDWSGDGYSLANNTEDSAFTHMAKYPGRTERFARVNVYHCWSKNTLRRNETSF